MQKSLSLLFALVLFAQPAWGAIDAAGAASLKKTVESEINWRKSLAQVSGRDFTTGTITVKPAGTFYEVKIPNISVSQDRSRGRLKIGTVTVNATPAKNNGWLISLALPPSMTMFDGNDNLIGTITIGQQKFSAACMAGLSFCPQMDVRYSDISLTPPDDANFKITLADFHTITNLTAANKKWSGRSSMNAKGLTVNGGLEGPFAMTVDTIETAVSYKNLDAGYDTRLRQSLGDAPRATLTNDTELAAFIDALLPVAKSRVEDVGMSFTASNLMMDRNGVTVHIKSLSGQNALNGLNQNKAAAAFKTQIDGISATASPLSPSPLLPETINISWDATDIPAEKISAVIDSTVAQAVALATTPASTPAGVNTMARMQMTSFAGALPFLLQEAGTTLNIRDTYIRNKDYDLTLTGQIKGNQSAAHGAAGSITLTITGLESVVDKMRQQSLEPNASKDTILHANLLSLLGMTGLADRAPDGRLIHKYTFEITEDNKMLINSMNMQPLINQAFPK